MLLASFRKDTRGIPKSTGIASEVLMNPQALVKCLARILSRANIFIEYRKLPSPRPYIHARRQRWRYSEAMPRIRRDMETRRREPCKERNIYSLIALFVQAPGS